MLGSVTPLILWSLLRCSLENVLCWAYKFLWAIALFYFFLQRFLLWLIQKMQLFLKWNSSKVRLCHLMWACCHWGRGSRRSFSHEESPSLEGDYPIYHFLGISEETVSFLRPLALRLFRIALPSAVDILFRNPCLLRRFRLLGWYVLFIFCP